MLNVGVIGLGMMGALHLDVYGRRDDVRIVALSDTDPMRLSGQGSVNSNVGDQAESDRWFDEAKKYDDGYALIEDPEVQIVDICLPTPLHLEYAERALAAGKHVLVEKPPARTSDEAFQLAAAAEGAAGMAMPAMVMRFWPGWDWLKQAIDQRTYGAVLGAHFRRVICHAGGPFYSDGNACGGALLDLHVHDVDFIHYCFGMPKAVFSRGYSKISGEIDHVTTQYIYDEVPLVTAEGGWAMTEGFDLQMQYTVNFERATAQFELPGFKSQLNLYEPGHEPRMISLDPEMGYTIEIDYFLDCVASNRPPETVTLREAAGSVAIVEAERRSIAENRTISLE